METNETTTEIVRSPVPEAPPPPQAEVPTPQEAENRQRKIITIIIVGIVFLLLLLGVVIYFLLQPSTPTDQIRDVFIIFVALESLVIGVALIVLIIQLSSLINLLQNEVRPILNATNETVNHLRGTTEFLGENVVEPVIKLNGYLAGMNRVIELMGMNKKK
jgi:hypothetical protein